MKHKTVYISVPVTGWERKKVIAMVNQAKEKLIDMGYNTICMTDLLPEDVTYHEAMGESIKFLLLCDAIYMCPYWHYSKGCNAEYRTAEVYGKELVL